MEQAAAAWCLPTAAATSSDGVIMNKHWYCLPFFLAFAFLPAYAMQASPQEALEEIATADKVETVIKHLPLKVEEHLKKLSAKDQAALMERLLISKNLEREGGKLSRSDSETAWELVEKEGKEKTTITFKNTYISGDNALVELEIKGQEQRRPETILIGMRLEGGQWRVPSGGQLAKD